MEPFACTLSFIGSGNIAWQLATGWKKSSGIDISYIYSRNQKTSLELAEAINAKSTQEWDHILKADAVIIAVQDNQIQSVTREIRNQNTNGLNPVLIHTSGYVSSEILKESDLESYGVLYPLQSLKKNKRIRLDQTPFFITASDDRAEKAMFQLARLLSSKVHVLTDEKRQILHMAAVMVNNFTHHILYKARELVKDNKMDPAWLIPLSRETVNSAFDVDAFHWQTGPARRRDLQVLEGHLSKLQIDPHLLEIYQSVTNSIIDTYKNENRS